MSAPLKLQLQELQCPSLDVLYKAFIACVVALNRTAIVPAQCFSLSSPPPLSTTLQHLVLIEWFLVEVASSCFLCLAQELMLLEADRQT